MNIENIIDEYKDHLMETLGISEQSQMGEMIEEATYEFLRDMELEELIPEVE